MQHTIPCPHCGGDVVQYRNPAPTVDIIIHDEDRGIVLIERKNEPLGYALAGGFIDYGESAEAAAVREAKEETGLDVRLTGLSGVYSAPDRDPRFHTMSVVFTAELVDTGAEPCGGDDAATAHFYPLDKLPKPIVFDHLRIIQDYIKGGRESY